MAGTGRVDGTRIWLDRPGGRMEREEREMKPQDEWNEYDAAAMWCAKRALKGRVNDPLPEGLSGACHELINADPEAFEQRVKDTACMLVRERRGVK